MEYHGGCFCGVVRYEVKAEPSTLINCHCQFCRRFHGAAFVTVAPVPSDEFVITAGRESITELKHAEGSRNYCGDCGSRIFNRPKFTDEFVMLIIASLDEALESQPIMHINTESKASWHEICDSLPQFTGMPPA
ncbi:MAG: GFA family protein [Halioglobus sp.]